MVAEQKFTLHLDYWHVVTMTHIIMTGGGGKWYLILLRFALCETWHYPEFIRAIGSEYRMICVWGRCTGSYGNRGCRDE